MNNKKPDQQRVAVPPFEILVDTREQTPLPFTPDQPTRRATLKTGDYSITGFQDSFTIERKSLADLVHTLTRDRARFENELERMTAFQFRGLVIEAPWRAVAFGKFWRWLSPDQKLPPNPYPFSRASSKAVLASLNAFEIRYGLHIAYCQGAREAAQRVRLWCYYYAREMGKRRQALEAEKLLTDSNRAPLRARESATGKRQAVDCQDNAPQL